MQSDNTICVSIIFCDEKKGPVTYPEFPVE